MYATVDVKEPRSKPRIFLNRVGAIKHRWVSIDTVDGEAEFQVPKSEVVDNQIRLQVLSHGDLYVVLRLPTSLGDVRIGLRRSSVRMNS